MKVLVACEYSGTVRDAFRALGHDAMSCDLEPTDAPGPHYFGDVRDVLHDGWDLMIAHPPCTYLTNSGVRWLNKDPSRWQKMYEAADFFRLLWSAPIKHIAIENPIMHGHAKESIGNISQSQVIQPWQFGHPESKATCLWLKNLPLLQGTKNVHKEMLALPKNVQHRLHFLPPSKLRWKLRSTTFSGIAEAMADQWGRLDTNKTCWEHKQLSLVQEEQ